MRRVLVRSTRCDGGAVVKRPVTGVEVRESTLAVDNQDLGRTPTSSPSTVPVRDAVNLAFYRARFPLRANVYTRRQHGR